MSSDGAMNEISQALAMAEEQYVKAKTCVWWDIENCAVPRSCDPYSIAQNIRKALAEWNYKGMVTISAYGDTRLINPSVQQALSSTGIGLNHVPAGIKDASDKKILVDMLMWGYDNPPPATHLLISGDRDFSNALHQLRMKGYNILLAQPEKASQALVSAAKTVWLWTSLVLGGRPLENIPELHNTLTCRKPNIDTQSSSILCSPQPDYFDQKKINFGDSDKHNKGKQISKSQSQPITNTLIDYLENTDKFADGLLPSMVSNLLASVPGGFGALLNNALKLEQRQMKAKDEQLNGCYQGEGSKPPKRKAFAYKREMAKKREHFKIKALKIKKNKASTNASTLSSKEKKLHKIKQKNKASANASTLPTKERGLHKIKAQKNKKNKVSTNSSTLSAAVNGQQIPNTTEFKCFKCGKAGHMWKKCPDTQGSVPVQVQAHDILPKDEIEKGNHHNNTSKTEALANAPVLPAPSTSQGVHTFVDCEKAGQFHNRCPEKQGSTPDQAYDILSSDENMEENQNQPKSESPTNAPALHTPPSSRRTPNIFNGKCFGCGKVGHVQNRCPGNQEPASIQAHNVLSRDENMEENHPNTPKSEALTNAPALHAPPTSRRIPNTFDGKCFGCGKVGHFHNRCPFDGKCFGCGKAGHFHNQCPGNREHASIQDYDVLSRDENMEVGTYNDTANAPVLPAPFANYGFPYTFEGQMLQRWNNGEFSTSMWTEPRTDSYPSFYRSFY